MIDDTLDEFDRLIAYVETWPDGGNDDGFADVLRRQRARHAALVSVINLALPVSRDPANDEEVCISGYDFWRIRAAIDRAPR